MNDVEKKALKEFVEKEGYNLYNEEMVAKEGRKDLTKAMSELTGLKVGEINKLVKTYYDTSMDDQKDEFDAFEELYKGVMSVN